MNITVSVKRLIRENTIPSANKLASPVIFLISSEEFLYKIYIVLSYIFYIKFVCH